MCSVWGTAQGNTEKQWWQTWWVRTFLYSCFEKGCLTHEVKRTRQGRKFLWVMVILPLLYWSSRCFSAVEGNSTNTCIQNFSFRLAESPWTSIKQRQTLTTHNTNRHCRVRFYTLVRQPLSKQLYTYTFILICTVHMHWYNNVLLCLGYAVANHECKIKSASEP